MFILNLFKFHKANKDLAEKTTSGLLLKYFLPFAFRTNTKLGNTIPTKARQESEEIIKVFSLELGLLQLILVKHDTLLTIGGR